MATSGATFVPAYYATLTAFNNDNTITDNQVSWIEDVKHLYVGRSLYPGANTILGSSDSFPAQASALVGVLYFKPSTGEIRRYTTTGFDVLAAPRVTVVNAASTDDTVPTAKAVNSAVNVASAALNTAIANVSSSLNASAAAKIPMLATGSGGYMVQTNATGGVQYTNLQFNSVVKSGSIDNGSLLLTNAAGATVATIPLGITGLVTSTFFNPDDATLIIYTDTTEGGEVSSSVIDLSSLVDVYTGEGERAFNPAVGSVVQYKTFAAGLSVAIGDVVKAGDTYFKVTTAGTIAGTVASWTPAHSLISPVTDTSANVGPGAYFLLDGTLWFLPNAAANTPASSYLWAGATNVSVQNYTVHVGLNLHDGGHLVNSSGGLAVSAAGTVGNNDDLVTGAAVVTYGGTLLTSVATDAQTKVNTASAALTSAVNVTSSALNAAKLDKPVWTNSNYLVLTASGGIQSSTYMVGGAALAATPTSATIATEKAVNDKINTVVSANITKWK